VLDSTDDTNPPRAGEPHHVTFFAPDRPVDGTTVYVVDSVNEGAEQAGDDGRLPR
jgi:hypothetical protein